MRSDIFADVINRDQSSQDSGRRISTEVGNLTLDPASEKTSVLGNLDISGDISVGQDGMFTGGLNVGKSINGLSVTGGTITTGVWQGSIITPEYGGTGADSYTPGDLLYAIGAKTLATRSVGKNGQVLKVVKGLPTWSNESTVLNSLTVDANTLYVDAGNNRVGVGTTSPAGKLTIIGGDTLLGAGTFNNSSSSEDLYVTGNLEVDGTIYGSLSASLDPGFSTGSVAFQGSSGLTEDNSNFFWDDTNNRLGINTTAPIASLHVAPISTDTSGQAIRTTYFTMTANAPSNSTGSYRAMNGQVVFQGSANYTGVGYGMLFFGSHTGTGTVSNLFGLSSTTENFGGGTITNAYGGNFAVNIVNNASTIGTAIGNNIQIKNDISGGAITTGYGLRVQSPIVASGATIDTLYGTRILNQGASGITNSYGLYVDNQSGATNSYAAIFAGGNVGIGTTTPQSTLHVPDGRYAQFEDNNAGPPPSGDCDSDTERGRLSIDTSNNRLYVCNGATRGWDFIALTDL